MFIEKVDILIKKINSKDNLTENLQKLISETKKYTLNVKINNLLQETVNVSTPQKVVSMIRNLLNRYGYQSCKIKLNKTGSIIMVDDVDDVVTKNDLIQITSKLVQHNFAKKFQQTINNKEYTKLVSKDTKITVLVPIK